MKLTLPILATLLLTVFSVGADEPEEFPLAKKVGSLEFTGRKDYERKELGYSLRYQSPSLLKAEVFVYDKGIPNLSNGILSLEVAAELETVKAVFRKLAETGKYLELKELESTERSFDDLKTKFLWTRVSYKPTSGDNVDAPGSRIADTYLTVHKKQFLKVRLTTASTDLEKHEPEITQFIHEVAKIVEKARLR